MSVYRENRLLRPRKVGNLIRVRGTFASERKNLCPFYYSRLSPSPYHATILAGSPAKCGGSIKIVASLRLCSLESPMRAPYLTAENPSRDNLPIRFDRIGPKTRLAYPCDIDRGHECFPWFASFALIAIDNAPRSFFPRFIFGLAACGAAWKPVSTKL